MRTVVVEGRAGIAAAFARALLPRGGRRLAADRLPEVSYVRPRVVLDADHIARYRRVCGFAAAHGVPIVYPQLLAFPLLMAFFAAEDCPWPAMGSLHLANRIEQYRRLEPGDALRVELAGGSLMAHERGQVFTLEISAHRDGELVWAATQSLLRLAARPGLGPDYASRLAARGELAHRGGFVAPAGIGRRYGLVSGDLNPIHLSALSARLFGFRRAIAHGMWTLAKALSMLTPPEALAAATLATDFKAPLHLPGSATLWAADAGDGGEFEVRDAKGEKPHLRGQLRFP